MQEHIKIYKDMLKEDNIYQRDVALKVGWSEWKMSRFLTGTDVKAGEFFELLSAMSKDFQRKFWLRFANFKDFYEDVNIQELTSTETAKILYAIADRLQIIELSKHQIG